MIGYLGSGLRQYGRQPIRIWSRTSWEFEAVLEGRIAPLLRAGRQPLTTRRLWIFPPGLAHGWTGAGAEPAEVAVFHFDTVPEPLRSLRMPAGFLCQPIVAADCRRLRACVAEADACLRHSDPRNALHGQRILVELCLLALRDLPRQSLPGSGRDDAGRVALALDWYREHMHEGPGIAAVARAVYCSPAHLRRLFHRELGRSPAAALAAERWQRACTLLLESEDGLDAIATACGYADATALSRAFKRHCGRSPRVWRKQPRGAV